MEEIKFNGIESKGWSVCTKWKSHDIRVELFQEEERSDDYPLCYSFRLYVDDTLRDSSNCQGYIPNRWLGSVVGLTHKILEDNQEILIEIYLSYHYRCLTKMSLSTKIIMLFFQFLNVFKSYNNVFKYGAVIHIGKKVLYNSAKWSKY